MSIEDIEPFYSYASICVNPMTMLVILPELLLRLKFIITSQESQYNESLGRIEE